MSRLIITPGALRGLERCEQFLSRNSPEAAERAAQVISEYFDLLDVAPEMGRPHADHPELRELLIPFGSSGYVALYRYVAGEDAVYVLAFRHFREAGYQS